jgi:alpha-L-rhamnosidase
MKQWLAYLERHSEGHIIPVTARVSTAGDWESVGDETPRDLVGTFYYALDVSQMAAMAAAIGQEGDAAIYRQLFAAIRTAMIAKFVAPDGTVAKGSQTAQVFALHLGLYPEGLREKVVAKLVENITAHQDHLTTGYLGSQWLLFALSENGHAGLAYKVLLQKTQPSWLFMAGLNQTTTWEGWTSLTPAGTFGSKRTSLDHEALGSVGNWMFQNIGGLVPDPASPGFKHFLVRPRPGGGLTHAQISYESPQGRIAARWADLRDRFTLEVEVPVNATATVMLPAAGPADITESGRPAIRSGGVVFAGMNAGSAAWNIGSGRYAFAVFKR